MDPLSSMMTVVAAAESVKKIISYLEDAHNAPKERIKYAQQAASVRDTLAALLTKAATLPAEDAFHHNLRRLCEENGTLQQLKSTLDDLEALVAPSQASMGRRMLKRAVWSFEKSAVAEAFSQVSQFQNHITVALNCDLMTLNDAIKTSQDSMGKTLDTIDGAVAALNFGELRRERAELEQWLSSLDFVSRHQEVLKTKQADTGQWLLKSEEFQHWESDQDFRPLWCPGIPGAGKTFMSAIVFEHLLSSRNDNPRVFVTCLFCNYQEEDHQTGESFLAALLRQTLQQCPLSRTPEGILKLWHAKKHGRPSFAELSMALRDLLSGKIDVFVVLDALDETPEGGSIRNVLLPFLRTLPIRLFITSRDNADIESMLADAGRLRIKATDHDLRSYVGTRILQEKRLTLHIRKEPELEQEIVETIVRRAEGMFLLARFHVDDLATKSNRLILRKALHSLPPNLSKSYQIIWDRIQSQLDDDRKLATRVLLWVGHAFGPLSLEALQHAIAIQAEPQVSAIDEASLDAEEILLDVCKGLIYIHDEDGTVGLVHFTAQEWLQNNSETLFPGGQKALADACLTYLSLPVHILDDDVCRDLNEIFLDGSKPFFHQSSFHSQRVRWLEIERLQRSFPEGPTFFRYAAEYWSDHVRGDLEAALMSRILGLFERLGNYRVALKFLVIIDSYGPFSIDRKIRKLQDRLDFRDVYVLETGTGADLQAATIFNLQHVVCRILKEGVPANKSDRWGCDSLYHAIDRGWDALFDMLVQREDVNLNAQYDDNIIIINPLTVAVTRGRLNMVRTLIEEGALVEPAQGGGSLLHYALEIGHRGIAELLLQEGADPETRQESSWDGGYEQTCCFSAISLRRDEEGGLDQYYGEGYLRYGAHQPRDSTDQLILLKLLDQHGADLYARNNHNQNIIHAASRAGRADIINWALMHDGFHIDERDAHGDTPLHCALAKYSSYPGDAVSVDRSACARLLLKSNARVDIANNKNRTPFFSAIENGYEIDLLERLLPPGAIDDIKDCDSGLTPLQFAARSRTGNQRAHITFFQELGSDITRKSDTGKSAAFLAVEANCFPTIEFLVGDLDVDVNDADDIGMTPILQACRDANNNMLWYLITHGADMLAKRRDGQGMLAVAKEGDVIQGYKRDRVRFINEVECLLNLVELNSGNAESPSFIVTETDLLDKMHQVIEEVNRENEKWRSRLLYGDDRTREI